jgi:putative CocE/NonD family hydrolase
MGSSTKKMYLSMDKTLIGSSADLKSGRVSYPVNYSASTGKSARWNSLTSDYMTGPTNYPDRRKEDEKLLCFTSDIMTRTTDLTGTPVIHLNFTADSNDATVFCYIEDVGPDSSVTYVTEGLFKPLHRKIVGAGPYKTLYPNHNYTRADAQPYKAGDEVMLDFDLLPISYQFKPGHRIRISIAGYDVGHFILPSPQATTFQIGSNAENPSYIELPLVAQ